MTILNIDPNSPIGLFVLMIIAWTALSLLAYLMKWKEKYGITIYPLIFIYESKKAAKIIEKQADKNPRFWRVYGKLSGPITLIFVFVSLGYFAWNLFLLYQNIVLKTTSAGVGSPVVPIIPFITIPANFFITLLVASAIAIIPHEFAHGVVARSEGVPLESAGIYVLFGVIFGGFVKLDKSFEETLENVLVDKSTSNDDGDKDRDIKIFSKKLYKVASAGLLANLILGLIIFGATIGMFEKGGVLVISVEPGSPAYEAGIRNNDVILAVGDYSVRSIEDLTNALSHYSPGDNVTVLLDRGEITITLGSSPYNSSRAYMGVSIWDYYKFKFFPIDKMASVNLYIFLTISYLLQITVIFLNALPLFVTDGSKSILSYLISKGINPKLAFNIYNLINIIGLSILLANIWISIGIW